MEERVRRWHSSHIRIQAYVSKEEFEKVKELALKMKTSVSELVKKAILDAGRLEKEVYWKGFDDGWYRALDEVEDEGPFMFLGIEEFAVSCPKCGKPMVFSSRFKEQWEGKVKPILAKAFSNWAHVDCLKK
jgi:hypothetical protein